MGIARIPSSVFEVISRCTSLNICKSTKIARTSVVASGDRAASFSFRPGLLLRGICNPYSFLAHEGVDVTVEASSRYDVEYKV